MTVELTCLAAITLFTGMMWMPYIANVVGVRGVSDALGYPEHPQSLAPWAERVDRAHRNAVENLIVFAPLVLIAHVAGVSNQATVFATTAYCGFRVVHFAALVFAVPVIKSVSFMFGAMCQVLLALSILAA